VGCSRKRGEQASKGEKSFSAREGGRSRVQGGELPLEGRNGVWYYRGGKRITHVTEERRGARMRRKSIEVEEEGGKDPPRWEVPEGLAIH